MKKTLLSLLLAAGSTAAMAQTTLTAANMNPSITEVYTSLTCDTTGVVVGAAGPSVTWDFSGLSVTSYDTGVAVACSSTPNCSMFPGTTIAIKAWTGSTVTYDIATSTAYSHNGYYYSASQFATFTDPLDQLHYPFTYLDSFTDSYAGTLTYALATIPITAHEIGSAKVKCDGYGTLKLPGAVTETNVLRVHSYQLFVDSASVFGIDTVASFILNTYSWYTPGYHSPLMTILESDQIGGSLHTKTVSFAKRYPTAIASVNEAEASLRLFPNPAGNELNISFTQPASSNVRISLTDLMGREVAVITDKTVQGTVALKYNTAALPRGLYLVRMQSGSETVTRKVTLQ